MSRAIPNEESATADIPTHRAGLPSVRLLVGQIDIVSYSTRYSQIIGDASDQTIKGMNRGSESRDLLPVHTQYRSLLLVKPPNALLLPTLDKRREFRPP